MIQAASPNVPAVKYVDPSNTSGTSEVCVGNPVAASTEVFANIVKQRLLFGTKGEIKGLFRQIQKLAKCHSEYEMI